MYRTIATPTRTAAVSLALAAATLLLVGCSSTRAEQSSNEIEAPPEIALAEESDPQPDALQDVVEITPTDDVANDDEPSGVFELDRLDGQIPAWIEREDGSTTLEFITSDDLVEVATMPGITQFFMPIAVSPDETQIVEVGSDEFFAYLDGESATAAIDRDPERNQFMVALEPLLDSEAADAGLLPARIAYEVTVLD